MTRMMFGGGPEDVYLVQDAEGDLKPGGGYPAFFFTDEVGGTALTDLLTIGQQPVTYITTSTGSDNRAAGQIPPFYGPDGLFEMWVSVNDSPRVLLQASNLGSFAGPLLNQLLQHLSAGINPHGTTLDALANVDDDSTGAATEGQALVKGAGGLWVAGSPVGGGGGGSGDATLAGAQTFTGAKTFNALTQLLGGLLARPINANGVGAIVRALSSQAGNVQEWQDNGGTARAWMSPSFGMYATNLGRTATFAKAGALSNGSGQFRWYNDSGTALTIRSVRASLGTPGSSNTIADVNVDGTTIYTTQGNRPTLGSGVSTSGRTTNHQVVNVPSGSYITADIDSSGTGAADLLVQVELW